MDPLSIASSVVGLTATCLATCKKLHDLAGEFQDVPAVIAMICSESTIIGIGLSQLQMKILQRDDLAQAWASKTEIWTVFETALTGCMIVFSCLEAETRSLRSENPGLWAKIKFIWNQDRLKELLVGLRGQQSSITFLLNLLELIKAAASQAQSLRSCNPSVKMDVESVFDNDAAKLSFFQVDAVSGIAPSELDFTFDDVVINSQAYRRVFIKARSEIQQLHLQHVDSDTATMEEVYRNSVESSKDDALTVESFSKVPISYQKERMARNESHFARMTTVDEEIYSALSAMRLS
ncbi:GTPase-activating of the rho rac family (LRG1) [Fusarium phyllophilum]|uniref:GTPase-activating of the rho rac family (LRG1) n=1 Tax=Fusarium phyllophilum TaxID=47803 RepID=A0A8H5NPI2_9HYPO|nr:GTPase-activating of the rho rac family (LRG1) [Fusarium phyllophilum]